MSEGLLAIYQAMIDQVTSDSLRHRMASRIEELSEELLYQNSISLCHRPSIVSCGYRLERLPGGLYLSACETIFRRVRVTGYKAVRWKWVSNLGEVSPHHFAKLGDAVLDYERWVYTRRWHPSIQLEPMPVQMELPLQVA